MMTVMICVSFPEEIVALDEWCEPGKRLHFVSLLEKGVFGKQFLNHWELHGTCCLLFQLTLLDDKDAKEL